jgi:hypothetical protein
MGGGAGDGSPPPRRSRNDVAGRPAPPHGGGGVRSGGPHEGRHVYALTNRRPSVSSTAGVRSIEDAAMTIQRRRRCDGRHRPGACVPRGMRSAGTGARPGPWRSGSPSVLAWQRGSQQRHRRSCRTAAAGRSTARPRTSARPGPASRPVARGDVADGSTVTTQLLRPRTCQQANRSPPAARAHRSSPQRGVAVRRRFASECLF